jgi:hypothetical protein
VSRNGSTSNGDSGALTQRQAEDLAEREAQDLLSVSRDEAFAMLERGELDGTAAEAEFRMLRFLVTD